jgi:hypothetical protein
MRAKDEDDERRDGGAATQEAVRVDVSMTVNGQVRTIAVEPRRFPLGRSRDPDEIVVARTRARRMSSSIWRETIAPPTTGDRSTGGVAQPRSCL